MAAPEWAAPVAGQAIDIELHDWNLDPLPNVIYTVTSKGGEVRVGRVDSEGMAHIEMATPGPYVKTFPEYGGEPF